MQAYPKQWRSLFPSKGVRGTGTLEMLQSRLYQAAKADAECSLVKHLGEQCKGKLQALFDVEGAGAILSFTLPRTLAQLLRADLVAARALSAS